MKHLSGFVSAAMIAAILSSAPALAGEIVAEVTVDQKKEGEIGCGLYASKDGFPTKPKKAVQQIWQTPENGTVICRFTDLDPGEYAISSSFDGNGNRKTDKNLFGIPKEPWGVSNNVRPSLRAPKFEEARVTLAADEILALSIVLEK